MSAAGTPASKPCSPREVRSRGDRPPCGERPPGRCSPGLGPLQSILQRDSGLGSSPRLTKAGCPAPHAPRGTRRSRRSRAPGPDPGLLPPGIRRHARSIGRTRHRRAATLARARLQTRHSPAANPARVNGRSVLPAPPLGGAPRLPRPWPQASFREAGDWTSKTRSKSRQWARLFRGEPTLLEFFPSSIRSQVKASRRLLAYSPFEPCGPTSASPRTRHPVAGAPHVLFAPSADPPDRTCARPVPRVVSFRWASARLAHLCRIAVRAAVSSPRGFSWPRGQRTSGSNAVALVGRGLPRPPIRFSSASFLVRPTQ